MANPAPDMPSASMTRTFSGFFSSIGQKSREVFDSDSARRTVEFSKSVGQKLGQDINELAASAHHAQALDPTSDSASDSPNYTSYSNNSMSANIAQIIGVVLITFGFYLYRLITKPKEDEATDLWELGLNRALLGFVTGINLASTIGKALPSLIGTIIKLVGGLVLGLGGAILFVCIPKLAKNTSDQPKQIQINFIKMRLGLKVGATILLSAAVGISAAVGLAPLAMAACSAGGFLAGALLGIQLFPKLCRYLEAKGDLLFSKQIDVSFNWGSTLGATSGALLGTCLFPGVGTAIGTLCGAGIGALIGITAMKVYPRLYHWFKSQKLQLAAKTGGIIGAGLGAVIGTILCPGLGTTAGIVIGTLAGTLMITSTLKIKKGIKKMIHKRTLATNESEITPRPFKDRSLLSQLRLGVAAGALSGSLIGTFAGPLGMAVGASVGVLVGLGGVAVYRTFKSRCLPLPQAVDDHPIQKQESIFPITNKPPRSSPALRRIDSAPSVISLSEVKEQSTPTTNSYPRLFADRKTSHVSSTDRSSLPFHSQSNDYRLSMG